LIGGRIQFGSHKGVSHNSIKALIAFSTGELISNQTNQTRQWELGLNGIAAD